MRRYWIVIFLLMMVLVGCQKKPIKVGFSANLTGTGSELSTAALYGATLAKNEINEKGGIHGRPIELVIKDDGNQTSLALEADRALIEEGAKVIIGHMISSLGELTVPYINEEKIPMVSPTMSSSVYADQKDYFFTLIPLSNDQADRMVLAVSELGYKAPGILYDRSNPLYTQAMLERIKKTYKGDLAFEKSFDGSGEGIDGVLDQLSEESYDCLLLVSSGYDVAKLMQHFYKQGLNVPVIMSSWGMSNDLLNGAGPAAEGVYAVNVFDAGSTSDAYRAFRDLYIGTYGEEPTFSSMYGYEAMTVVGLALEDAGSLSGEAIKGALNQLGTIQGLQGDFEFDPEGDVNRRTVLFQVKEGRFVKIEE